MVPVKSRVPVPVIFAVDVKSFVIEILPSFIIAVLFVKSPVLIVPAFESVPLFIKDVVWIFPPVPMVSSESVAFKFTDFNATADISLVRFG